MNALISQTPRPALHRWAGTLAWLVAAYLAIISNGYAQTLGQALDNTNLTWTTSGSGGGSAWHVTSTSPHNGLDDATSGTLPTSGSPTSTLQTTLVGPGTLTFWWRNDSTACLLGFISGTNTLGTFGNYPSWQLATCYLGSGTQTFKWVFSRYSSFSGAGAAYVDGVDFIPGTTAPAITAQPLSQSQVRGLDATFTVAANGTPPLSYQWQFNGIDIPGATSNSYTIVGIQATNLGAYRVIVSNTVDSATSFDATLGFGRVASWGLSGYNATAAALGATNLLAVAGGGYWNVGLRTDRTLLAWGYNVSGQTNPPADLTNILVIAAGTAHGLALLGDGAVAVWGTNGFGPTNVPSNASNVVAIAAGDFHSLALRADGSVVAWGSGLSGATNVPAGLSNVVAISAGGLMSMALKADGTIVQLGGIGGPILSNIVAIAAGGNFCLALGADGRVAAWGQDSYGILDVSGLSNVVAIAAGEFQGLALRANGTVAAWGYPAATNVPPNLTNVVAISAGDFHNLALVGDGPPVMNASITDANWTSNGFVLSIPTQSGRVYALQYKDSLPGSNWTSLPLVAGTGTNLVLRDTTATGPGRSYRVLRW